MRKMFLATIGICFTLTVTAQTDYCTPLSKAVAGAKLNFVLYNDYKFNTQGGKAAFLADFSFVPGMPGYIYKDQARTEVYFYQKLDDDISKYQSYYSALEQCLVKESDKWTKLDGKDGNAVIFSCYATGGEVILISGNAGITLKIQRDKKKSISVLSESFCRDLETIANAGSQGFGPVLGRFRDSGILGRSYECTLKLNQRSVYPTIYQSKDIFDKNSMNYSLTEMFKYYDIPYDELVKRFEQCLTPEKGWVKSPPKYGDGTQFTKGDIKVMLTTELKKVNPDTFVRIDNSNKMNH